MNINAELLCTTLLEQARRRGEVAKWIEVAISFIKQQDAALRAARDGLRDGLGAAAELQRVRSELEVYKAIAASREDFIQEVEKALGGHAAGQGNSRRPASEWRHDRRAPQRNRVGREMSGRELKQVL